ncbi:MAG: ABC transporter substrate-binding protein [Defluviitaleaceae bacterium]|nr:ABC transporter substrate-binding protein [Defluviitaleaceae bacterium]
MKRIIAFAIVLIMIAGCAPAAPTGTGTAPAGGTQQGAAGGDTAPAAEGRDTVRMALHTDLNIFDPMNSGMTLDQVVYKNIFDTLLNFYDGQFERVLATDYSITPDGLTYEISLRQDVRFHNGEPFTAADVVFSMTRAQDSVSFASMTASIESVVAVDDHNVVITLSEPYIPFLQAVIAGVPIMNEAAVVASGDNVGFEPIGTGPYRFVSFEPGQRLTLIANDYWHGGAVPITHAVFNIIIDPSSALMAVEAGDVDLSYSIPPIEAARLEASDAINFRRNSTTGSGFILFNLEQPPFDDVYFRRAFAHAIDRQAIAEIGMEGMAIPAYALWDERFEGYSGRYPAATFDLDLAREYLERSSYAGETLHFRVGMEMYRRITLLVQEQLREIGVDIEVAMMETNAWVTDMRNGNFEISTVVFTFDLDVDYWERVLHSSNIGNFNFPRLNRPEVDDAFDRGSSILDRHERIDTYAVIERVVNEEAIVIPIYWRVIPCVYHRDLEISRAYPSGFSRVIDMSWR